jgi:membrane fusion protein (multidrug efflux system)
MKGIKAFLQNLSPLLFVLVFMSCKEKKEEYLGIPLPIKALQKSSAITTFEFLGAIEGKVNVEIRPQVEGVLEKIYIDEGAFVQAGQPLFKVNELPYVEQMKNAQASVAVEKARVENARIELDRLRPLVDNGVISDIQLRTAQSNFELAKASLTQAQTTEATARINLNFTNIKAPVSGYIGRIPKRIGNLVAKNDNQPMTVLSDIEEVFVYFAMSESDYLFFKRMSMDSTARKINPNVKLVLADGSVYEETGRIDADAGQVDRSTGAISLRATFPNPNKLLRSGNTGKVIMEQIHPNVILVPQTATSVIQDKTFVFRLNKENLVERIAIDIEGKSGRFYIVRNSGLNEDDRIVVSGLDKLTEGVKVNPMSEDQILNEK